MAELISIGTTATSSADFTLASGVSTTLHMKTATGVFPSGAAVAIELKAGSVYTTIGGLTDSEPVRVLAAPGVYRVRRILSTVAFGVERD